jgi:hypothetical protein
MANVLGVLAFIVFIALVVSTAASVTWLVVRFSPTKKPAAPPTEP